MAAALRQVVRGCGKLWDGVAFGALIKRKRGDMRLSQENLAANIFGDSNRKGDISRIENAKTTPQEQTIAKLCRALKISEAEMAPIRTGGAAQQLDQIPTLDRDQLELLASRFGAAAPHDQTDAQLRGFLTDKAGEFRTLQREFAALAGVSDRIDNIRGAAEDALTNMQLDQANELLENAREIVRDQLRAPLQANATLSERQADIALLRGDAETAFTLLSAAADSFAALDPMEPVRMRLYRYAEKLWQHGLRYGGTGLHLTQRMIEPLLNSLDADQNLDEWATTQNVLGMALAEQGRRVGGEAGNDLLTQAVVAYRSVLRVWTEDAYPEHWATTQNNLSATLADQGNRIGGEAGGELLAQAVAAYRSVLRVRTEDAHPVQWATTQNNLGVALRNQGNRIGGDAGGDLLAQAVAAYRNALRVWTKDAHPVHWAGTQNNLGTALKDQGNRIGGDAGGDLLAQAVAAYRSALRVWTEDAHPVHWATTQNNLGTTLADQGNRIGGEAGGDLLAQAVAAYRSVLCVWTEDAHPVDWAMTQNNLGLALGDQGNRIGGEAGDDLLTQAVAAYRSALRVWTEDAHPVHWATAQNNLGNALGDQGNRIGGDAGGDLLAQAVVAYRSALRVYTEDAHPVHWAETQANLAICYLHWAALVPAAQARGCLETAMGHVQATFQVFDPKHMPHHHGTATRLRDIIQARLDDPDLPA